MSNFWGAVQFSDDLLMSAQNGLLEFVSVLQSNDVGVVFETRAGCAFAVHIVAGGVVGVVVGVVDVDVTVSGIEDVVFAKQRDRKSVV